MNTSKTALAAAAFGAAAAIAPVSAEEVKYNFTSEFGQGVDVAADERTEGGRFFEATNSQGNPEVGQSLFGSHFLDLIASRNLLRDFQTHVRQVSARQAAEKARIEAAERARIAAARERRAQQAELRERIGYENYYTWSRPR